MLNPNMVLVGTDKNGTETWYNFTCPRCAGQGGRQQWGHTGFVCYNCGGTGRATKPEVIKKYTPEYQAKLDADKAKRQAKKDAERMANAETLNKEFIEKHFNGSDKVFIINGNTYEIKDQLKSEGCKFNPSTGWYAVTTTRDCLEISVEELLTKNEFGEYNWKEKEDVTVLIKTKRNKQLPESNYVGTVGEKYTGTVTFKKETAFEMPAFRGNGLVMMRIITFVDDSNNLLVWKTTCAYDTPGTDAKVNLTGTIKEHSEYMGQKQTILTRCKIN